MIFFLNLLALLLTAAATAQELQGVSPPIRETPILADLKIEDPPVYSGVPSAPAPRAGETIEFQIFVPEAAGKQAYSYIVEFQNADSTFQDLFRIRKADAWTETVQTDARGRVMDRRLVRLDMSAPRGSKGPGRSILFVARPNVPGNALVATVILEALQDIPSTKPFTFTVSTAIYATTSPARIWHFAGTGRIFWQ